MFTEFKPLTKEILFGTFCEVFSKEYNLESLRDVMSDKAKEWLASNGYAEGEIPDEISRKCDEYLLKEFVNKVLTDDVIDYINENMDYNYYFSSENNKMLSDLLSEAKNGADNMPDDAFDTENVCEILPVIGGKRSVLVGSADESFTCSGPLILQKLYSFWILLDYQFTK